MYRTLLFTFFVLLSFNNLQAETLILSNGLTFKGKIGEVRDDIVIIHTNQIENAPLQKIIDVKVDEGISDKEKKLQQKRIQRLEPLINRLGFESDQFATQVYNLLVQKRFEELDQLAAELIANRTTFSNSGYAKLNTFYSALKQNINTRSIHSISRGLELIDEWINETGSQAARIAKIDLKISLAWAYRGSSYSNTVAKENWEAFHKNLNEAETIAESLKSSGTNDPMLFENLITIYMATGKDDLSLIQLAFQSAEVYPQFYETYYGALVGLLPKWGGSISSVNRFIRQITTHPKLQNEKALYFRLVRNLAKNLRYHEFAAYQLDWEKTQASFEAYKSQVRITEYDYHTMAKIAGLLGENEATLHYLNKTSRQWNYLAERVWSEKSIMTNIENWAEKPTDREFSQLLVGILSQYNFLTDRELIKVYITAGGDIDQTDAYGNSMLTHSIRDGYLNYAYYLATEGADVNQKNVYGDNAISLATSLNRVNIMPTLIDAGADLTYTNNYRHTLAHLAAGRGFNEMLALLIKHKPSLLNQTDKYLKSPLHHAVYWNHLDTVSLLTHHKGVLINAQNNMGNTPLHDAVSRGNFNILAMLIDKGADPNIKNHRGRTVLSLAKSLKQNRLITYLEGIGAKDSKALVVEIIPKEMLERAANEFIKSKQFFNSKDHAKAEMHLKEAIRINPNYVSAYYSLAILQMYHSRKYEEARDNIEKAFELGESDPEALYTAGRIYHALNMPEKYKPLFQKYVELAPNTYNATDLKRNWSSYLRDNQVDSERSLLVGLVQNSMFIRAQIFVGEHRSSIIASLGVFILLLILVRLRSRKNDAS